VITAHPTPGGRIVKLDALTADGHVHAEITYLAIKGFPLISVWLNGGLIRVPDMSRKIYRAALVAEGNAIDQGRP
jgi:hypothetical protein